MASILGVETLQHTNGTTAAEIKSDGTFYPAGGVVQVKQSSTTSQYSFTSTALAGEDLSGLSVTITPKSSNSKILVSGTITVGGSGNNPKHIKLLRDTTELGGQDNGSRPGGIIHTYAGEGSDPTYKLQTFHFEYLDSPSTTSQITYKLKGMLDAGTGYINRTGAHTDNTSSGNGWSAITVKEIAE